MLQFSSFLCTTFLLPIVLADLINVNISTQLGPVLGFKNTAYNVYGFDGLPYTENTPVGEYRFKRMTRRTSAYSSNPFSATSSTACMQTDTTVPNTAEDCLHLNIRTADLTNSKPVIVWIHGGAFIGGYGAQMPGELFALSGLVYVSINYRLGFLGFYASEELYLESNVSTGGMHGISDQIAALEWIQHNIKDFGGDPDDVTVFGESAGGLSVCQLLMTPLAADLFDKVIIQSGACFGPWGPLTKQQAFDSWQLNTNGASLETLRGLEVSALHQMTPIFMQISVDEDVMTSQGYVDNIISGEYKPELNADKVIIGATSFDSLQWFFKDIVATPQTAEELELFLKQYYDYHKIEFTTDVLDKYYVVEDFVSYSNFNAYETAWIGINSDVCLVCPTADMAKWLDQYGLETTYLYLFHGANEPYYAMHGEDIPYAFGVGASETLNNDFHGDWVKFALDRKDIRQMFTTKNGKTIMYGGKNGTYVANSYFDRYRDGVCEYWAKLPTQFKNDLCNLRIQTGVITIDDNQDEEDNKSEGKSPEVWIIIGIVIVLGLVAGVIFMWYRNQQAKKEVLVSKDVYSRVQ